MVIFPETTLHVLCVCDAAKELRKSVGHSLITNQLFQQPLKTWLEENIKNLDEIRHINGINWPLIFIPSCNLVWFCTNLIIFEGKDNVHLFLAFRILNLPVNKKVLYNP